MGMLGTCIHVEVAVQGVAKTVFRKHTTDGVFEHALGMGGEDLGRGGLALATGVTSVTLINLVGHFLTGEDDFLSIDDDNIVTTVDVWGEARFGLASQDVGHAGSQTSDGLILGINQNPFLLDGVLVGRDGLVT